MTKKLGNSFRAEPYNPPGSQTCSSYYALTEAEWPGKLGTLLLTPVF